MQSVLKKILTFMYINFNCLAIILLLACSLASCATNNTQKPKCQIDLASETQIWIPEEFEWSLEERPNTYVIKYLNSSCGICISELEKWKELLNGKERRLKGIEIKFIVSGVSEKDAEFPFYKVGLSTDIFFDKNYAFFDSNKISNDRNLQTLLVANDKVVWKGSEENIECAVKNIKNINSLKESQSL